MKKVSSVEEYIENQSSFTKQLNELRALLLSTELDETIKWSAPVYTIKGKNVVGLAAFKQHYCLWFFNGVFLKDENKLLVNAQEGKTKALRQLRFTAQSVLEKPLLLNYIKEAIANEKLGKRLAVTKTPKVIRIPELLEAHFKAHKTLKMAFNKLSPSKQREYCEFISSAKREATQLKRLDKITPLIREGKGLNDAYKC